MLLTKIERGFTVVHIAAQEKICSCITEIVGLGRKMSAESKKCKKKVVTRQKQARINRVVHGSKKGNLGGF